MLKHWYFRILRKSRGYKLGEKSSRGKALEEHSISFERRRFVVSILREACTSDSVFHKLS